MVVHEHTPGVHRWLPADGVWGGGAGIDAEERATLVSGVEVHPILDRSRQGYPINGLALPGVTLWSSCRRPPLRLG